MLVATAGVIAVGFNVPVAELLSGRDLARHPALRTLGPDLLSAAFDGAEVIRLMRARGPGAVADVLLDQHVVAGIGNVFKSEILFLAGIEPFRPVAALSDTDLERLIGISRDQLAANVMTRSQMLNPSIRRSTTRSLDPQALGPQRAVRRGTMIQVRRPASTRGSHTGVRNASNTRTIAGDHSDKMPPATPRRRCRVLRS